MLRLPEPVDQAVHKLWGYASDRGRHVREQQTVDTTEAELIVAVSGSLCAFLTQRRLTLTAVSCSSRRGLTPRSGQTSPRGRIFPVLVAGLSSL